MKTLFTLVFVVLFSQTQGIPTGQPTPGQDTKVCGEEYLKVEYLPTGYIDKHYWVDCEVTYWEQHYGWYSWNHDDTVELMHGEYWSKESKIITELW